MRLTDLLSDLVPLSADAAATDINGMAVNSSQVKKGDLFFALPGTARDGRDFIDDAIKRGAVAVVTSQKADAAFARSTGLTGRRGRRRLAHHQPTIVSLLSVRYETRKKSTPLPDLMSVTRCNRPV